MTAGDRTSLLRTGATLLLIAAALFFGGGAGMDALAHGFHGDFPETLLAVLGAWFVRAIGIAVAVWAVVVLVRAI